MAPAPQSAVDFCYLNVSHHIKTRGGTGLYGWKVLEFPRLLLQALHHAVWSRKDGTLIDVTHDVRKWRQIVFAADVSTPFSGLPPMPIMPRFMNISGLREIDEVIDISNKLTEMRIDRIQPDGAMPALDPSWPDVPNLTARANSLIALAQLKAGVK